MRTLAVLLLGASVLAQGHNRTENVALLGIVAVPVAQEDQGATIVVAHVLKKSPAAKAGLAKGDELLSIAGKKIEKPQDIDAALASFARKDKVDVEYRRAGQTATVNAKLIARKDYKGDFLKRQTRGKTGFKAPDWFVYAWEQARGEPPTRVNTKGKVVVLHCFQSW